MSYRDDASALLARVNALERELRTARREIAALRREAGYPVADEVELLDVEIREDDLDLARQMLSGLLDEPRRGARPQSIDASDAASAPQPAVERDAATEQLVVLRRALIALLDRKLVDIPAPVVARVDGCPTATQLIEWIAAVGITRSRRAIVKLFEKR